MIIKIIYSSPYTLIDWLMCDAQQEAPQVRDKNSSLKKQKNFMPLKPKLYISLFIYYVTKGMSTLCNG